jgi:oligosaccharide repeat unit polymerase
LEILAYAVAIFFGLQFVWSYYWNCYRKGYTMDIWHFTLLSTLFTVHIMLPFSRSDLNVFALGYLLPRTKLFVTEAYLISALGYAGLLLGSYLWQAELGLGIRKHFAALLEVPAQGPLLLLRNKPLLLTHGALCVTLITAVLGYYFKLSGFGFNLRGLLLTYPALRPVAQFTAFYSVLIGSMCLARYSVYKERSMLVVVLAIMSGLLFFGERSTLLSLMVLTVMVGFLKLGRRLKPFWFAAGILGGLTVVFLLNALREPNFSLKNGIARFGMEIFYGNSFSDVRDFALVLSFWDGHYFYGMTYLAGLLAFIPRVLLPFRDHWAIGVVTATMAGFSPTQHPGLRPGIFGEAFLNFGLAGALFLGVLVGAVSRFIDLRMKQALKHLPKSSLKVYSYFILGTFVSAVEITANASTVYTVVLIFVLSWALLRMARFLRLDAVGA